MMDMGIGSKIICRGNVVNLFYSIVSKLAGQKFLYALIA